jgi:hypothetical protein
MEIIKISDVSEELAASFSRVNPGPKQHIECRSSTINTSYSEGLRFHFQHEGPVSWPIVRYFSHTL